MKFSPARLLHRRNLPWLLLGIAAIAAVPGAFAIRSHLARASTAAPTATQVEPPQAPTPFDPSGPVRMERAQQEAINLKVEPVAFGTTSRTLRAPGRVAPDETRYAYITPRAAGIVRTVGVQIGQEVKAGDVLATIDSPEVGSARLELYTKLQERDIARTRAEWQETIYKNTLTLIERLKAGDTPDQIHDRFQDQPVGANRERLVTAYAEHRLASATMARNEELHRQSLISLKQFQEVRARYEAALATFQALMDQMGFDTRLANIQAQQALRQAETAVRVVEERLRVLGVEPEVRGAGLDADQSEAIPSDSPGQASGLVSTVELHAPFDGTVIDREMIVPGVAVDLTRRIFTLGNLASVWVEVNIHESDFGMLSEAQGGRVRFVSDAYPGESFEGEVLYTGDLVDEKTRSIRLLARAENPERKLKPGMFVEVELEGSSTRQAAMIPRSAVLTEGDEVFVYARTGPETFERRAVRLGHVGPDRVAVLSGLEPGEEVVIQGAYKLRSEAIRLAGS